MDLTLITAPAEAPVTIAEAKAHLRYLAGDQDSLIEALILAATAHFDGRAGILGRALVTQTWELKVDRFPRAPAGLLELPLPPLQSVTSIKYLDDTGTEAALAPETYVVEAGHYLGRIRPAYGLTWPNARDETGAVRVRFVTGYGAAAAVPRPIAHAILLLVAHWWINREATGDAKGPHAFAVDALTFPYRVLAA